MPTATDVEAVRDAETRVVERGADRATCGGARAAVPPATTVGVTGVLRHGRVTGTLDTAGNGVDSEAPADTARRIAAPIWPCGQMRRPLAHTGHGRQRG